MNAKLEFINSMTDSGSWLERVQEEMGHGKEILLVLAHIDQAKSNALAKLCSAYHYSQDSELPFAYWDEYRSLLELNDYAAKEHGIGAEMVCFLHPQSSQSNRHHLG